MPRRVALEPSTVLRHYIHRPGRKNAAFATAEGPREIGFDHQHRPADSRPDVVRNSPLEERWIPWLIKALASKPTYYAMLRGRRHREDRTRPGHRGRL